VFSSGETPDPVHPTTNKNKSTRQGKKSRSQNVKSSGYSLMNKARMSLHTGFPARYTTAIKTEMQVAVSPGLATFNAGNYFNCIVNSINTPFNTSTYPINGSTGIATYAFNAAFVNGYSITDCPMYYQDLALIYQQYKVLKYSFKVTARSTSSADVFSLCLFPLGNQSIPSTSTSTVNMRVFGSQPRSRQVEIAAGQDRNSVSITQNVWDLLEIRRSAWLDLSSSGFGQAPTGTTTQSTIGYVGCYVQMLNAANNIGSISITVELIQEIELTDQVQPIN